MSTETSTPKPPKKGTVAAANLRIEALEGSIKEMQQAKPKECCSKQNTVLPEFGQVKPWHRRFIAEGRISYARPGIVLPKGVKPHAYVRALITVNADSEFPAVEAVEAVLQEAADDKHPNASVVMICNFYEVPLQWGTDIV